MGKYPAEPSEKESKPMTWCLRPTGSGSVSGSIPPGVYAIQNKSSDTFVSLSPDESTVSCWPDSDLAKTGVKLVRSYYDDYIITGSLDYSGKLFHMVQAIPSVCRERINIALCNRG